MFVKCLRHEDFWKRREVERCLRTLRILEEHVFESFRELEEEKGKVFDI